MTYRNCKKLIELGRCEREDMLNKLDIFLLNDRITQVQYEELIGLLPPASVAPIAPIAPTV